MKAQNLILFSLCSCMFLASVGTSIANVALPELAKAFSVTYAEIKWVIVLYLAANTVSIVGMGRLGDLYGRQKVLHWGIFIFSVSSLLSAFSPTLGFLLAFRIGQGVGAAILMALSVALVGELLPKEKMGRAMGFLGTSSAIGTASGPSIGGILLSLLGWPAIFIFIGTLGLISLGLTLKTEVVRSERKERQPFIYDKTLLPNLAMNICVSAVMMSTLVVGPFYLSQTLGLETMMVGLIMTVGPVMSIFSGIPAGRSVDRLGAGKVIRLGLMLLLIGAISFSYLPSHLGVTGYIISALLLSPGYQMFQAGNNSQVMLGVSAEQRGVISGMLSLSRNIGLIIGASVMGSIFVAQGMPVTFVFAAGIALVALLLSFKTKGQI